MSYTGKSDKCRDIYLDGAVLQLQIWITIANTGITVNKMEFIPWFWNYNFRNTGHIEQ